MAEKKNKTKSVNIKNKRASFDFLLLDKYTAGIVLTGTEIKSIRAGKASLVDTFCFIHNGATGSFCLTARKSGSCSRT